MLENGLLNNTHIRIAGSEIAVIRKVKNATFIFAVSPLRNVLAVFANNNYYLVLNPTLPLSPEPLKQFIMIKITYQEGNMSISYDLQGEPTQKKIIETAIFVLEREQV